MEQGKQYSGAGTTKEDVEELNRDIRFIGRSEPHFSKGSGIRVGSPVFATAVGFSSPQASSPGCFCSGETATMILLPGHTSGQAAKR